MELFSDTIFGFVNKHELLTKGSRVLVACSGGVDSVALLHFLSSHREKLNIEVAAVHVNHMLRGEESKKDGDFVRALCETLNVPFYGSDIPIPEIVMEKGGNLQAVCREERYEFFTKVMREHQFGVLATAHHAEDQLETMLMQLTKGVTPTGIPIQRQIEEGHLIRPFLPVKKEDLYAYLMDNNLGYREDPSNASDAYMRNRFRQHIVPFVLKENEVASENAVKLSVKLQEDDAYLTALAKDQLDSIVAISEEGLPYVDGSSFSSMPTALQRRMIPLLLNYLYDKKNVPVVYKTGLVEQLLNHLDSTDGNISIDLPHGYRFVREYDKLTFVEKENTLNDFVQKTLPKGTCISWENKVWLYWNEVDNVDEELVLRAKSIMYFDFPNTSLPLTVRHRQDGDRIRLTGMANAKRLSRLFIDEKVGKSVRQELPVLVTAQDEVCAVPGLRYGDAFMQEPSAAGKYIFLLGEIVK
ncbi:tRNA lysidine(34) synthetase TilS [Sporosarcina sp. CAU 1771]